MTAIIALNVVLDLCVIFTLVGALGWAISSSRPTSGRRRTKAQILLGRRREATVSARQRNATQQLSATRGVPGLRTTPGISPSEPLGATSKMTSRRAGGPIP
jgi:hypothetical protein